MYVKLHATLCGLFLSFGMPIVNICTKHDNVVVLTIGYIPEVKMSEYVGRS